MSNITLENDGFSGWFCKGHDVDLNDFAKAVNEKNAIDGMPPINTDHVERAFAYYDKDYDNSVGISRASNNVDERDETDFPVTWILYVNMV